ncbi:hypothetical protein [Pedobacter alpinus]|uniref:Uncharacterized protein n=1 Tax=Pedobacter alpinus TaxID=1590643 RepID=A0ABW5TSL3_9SPHI
MREIKITFIFLLITVSLLKAQVHLEQNGLKTSVTNTLYADNTQAIRYEIATVSYNSHHWQPGGIIIVELFEQSYGVGYERYMLEIGFGRGVNVGERKVSLLESYGINRNAQISLGAEYDIPSNVGGYVNRATPIYLDVKSYGGYKARISYMQDKVTGFSGINQIIINATPSSLSIPDFIPPSVDTSKDIASSGNLRISGEGIHYIETGNVGIGTLTPQEKLSVNGKIRAREIKVETANWPDYVFGKNYQLPDLKETETFIKINKHLPGIPSAEEVEKNGVSLGEMNAKLLKKIEELTLYVIQLQKENDLIKATIKGMK